MSIEARPEPSHSVATSLGARLRWPVVAAAATVATFTVVGTRNPYEAGHYPSCPFLVITGYYCPGCGALRAIHDLAHLDVASAMARNPLAVIAMGGLIIAYVVWTRRLVRGEPRRWMAPPQLLYALLGLIVAYWALRNVPGWTWLSPA